MEKTSTHRCGLSIYYSSILHLLPVLSALPFLLQINEYPAFNNGFLPVRAGRREVFKIVRDMEQTSHIAMAYRLTILPFHQPYRSYRRCIFYFDISDRNRQLLPLINHSLPRLFIHYLSLYFFTNPELP